MQILINIFMKKKYIANCLDKITGHRVKTQKMFALLLFAFFGVLTAQSQVTVAGAITGDGSYTTLGAAFSAIGTSQTGANITIAITGNTTETAVASLGAGDWTSLTITPSGGSWTISGSLTSELIQFNGADNVTINGLNSGGNGLTITNTNATATAGTIKFLADATNNTITNCSVLGSTTVAVNNATPGGLIFFGTGTTTGNDGNTISNCNVGPAGANLPSKLIGSFGSTTNATIANSGNTITNCNLYDYFLTSGCAAVHLTGGNADWTVTNNKMYQTAARTFTAAGILYGVLSNDATNGGNLQITGNTIGYANSAGTGTLTLSGVTVAGEFQGIYFNVPSTAANAANINNNTIANISLTSSTGRFFGIYNGATASSNTININSNTIRNISTAATNNTVNPIYAGAATTLNCNNNTINTISRTGAGILYGINYGAASNIMVNSNTITNLSSTNITSTAALSGIQGGGALIEAITNNTVTGLNSSSTGNQRVCGIQVASGTANKTIQNNIVNTISVPASAIGDLHGIRMSAGGALNIISGNTVSSLSGPNSVNGTNGIFMSAGTVANVYSNKVYGLSGAGTAASVYGFSIQGGGTYNIYNNIIGDLSTPVATNGGTEPHLIIGINSWGMPMNLYHNTIVLNGSATGTNFGSSALSTGGPLTLRNNILINNLPSNGTGVSVALRLNSGISNYGATSDNNLFKGTAIHTTNGLTGLDVTLDAFKTRVGNRDVLSVTENPTFVSTVGSDANYLHINTTVPTQIESGGATIATVTSDFDGDIRNTTTPDIGADEFTGVAIDLVGPVITHTPDAVCATGSRTVSATITDATGVPTTGAGLPVAYWRINSGAYTAAVGTSMGSGVYDFTIGTGSIAGDVVSYYFVAQDVVGTPNVSVYPSLGATGFTVNPPAVTTPTTTPFKLLSPMIGVYTVGTTGTYTSLTAAIADYNTRCLAGPVTFSLLDTTYSAGETFPVVIQQNADASAVNTLTIKPAVGVTATISGSNTSAILKLNGADYIIIDGSNNRTNSQDLTFKNTNTGTSSAVVWLASTTLAGATNNTIKNTVVTGQTATTATRSAIVSSGSTITAVAEIANSGNRYQNNTISLAKIGIEILGPTALQSGTVITQNAIGTNVNALGVCGIAVTNESATDISSNTIQKVSTSTSVTPLTTAGGIVLLGTTAGVVISNNTIKDIKSTANLTAGNSVGGIVTTVGNTNTIINGNTITGVANTSTSAYGARGITILGSGTIATNNMISDIYNYQGSALGTASTIGIAVGGTVGTVSLYNNTVHLFGPHAGNSANTTSGVATCIYIATTGTGLDIRNNILMNSYDNTTSSGDKSYAIYTTAIDNTQFTAIDNNDYVAGNATLSNTLGYLTSDKITLADIIAVFGGNANSKNTTPVFTSNVDLHLVPASNIGLDNFGTPIVSVATDIDGQTRNSVTPDMGADEFTAPTVCTVAVGGTSTPAVATLCASGSTTVSATGYTVENGITYQWQSSSDAAFTTPVNEGAAVTTYANLSTPTISSTTYYRLVVTCAAGTPNYSSVSTVTVTTTAAPTGTSPQTFVQGQTLADIVVTGNNIIWYASAIDAANAVSPLPTSTLLVDNTTYYATQTVSGCVSTTSLAVQVNITLGADSFSFINLKAYPNPVNDVLQIENSEAIATIEVFNIAGQKVISKFVNSMVTTIPMSGFAAGTYFFKISTEKAVRTIKINKK
jgi:type IX secretion system substrate protein